MRVNTVTLLGHKDHGKSTLIGNLLITTKSVSAQRINDAKKTSRNLGRHFEPGFILDSFEEERKGGLTIDTTRAQILYKGKAFEFIDVPGHEELIKNMISGASNADFAVLMVSAKYDEGIQNQTFRHLYLARMLGIRRIVVAVNKIDRANYDKKRFEEIKARIKRFLIKIGFAEKNIDFVPVSAYNAENLTTISGNTPWYKGKTLLDLMSRNLNAGRKPKAYGTRVSVQGSIESGDGRLVIGKVLSGTIKEGDTILIMPKNAKSKILKMYIKGKKSKSAAAGQNIAIKLNANMLADLRGSIICSSTNPARPLKTMQALIFAVKKPVAAQTMKFNGNSFPCKIKVDKVIDTTTGDTVNKPLSPLNAAIARIELKDPIMAEPFIRSEELGRFVLYDGQDFSGIGVVL